MASFNQAFASARKAGKKTFTWNGKSYTTQTKEEAARKSSPTPRPASERPSGAPKPRPASERPRPKEAPKPAPRWKRPGNSAASKWDTNNGGLVERNPTSILTIGNASRQVIEEQQAKKRRAGTVGGGF